MHKRPNIEDQDPPYDFIQYALESFKKGDYISTIEYSDKAITRNPRNAVAYNIKGQALFNLKKYDDALVCYEKALELRPRYIEALINRGLTLATLGKYDKAIECFNQSIDLNPNDTNIWNSKGLAFNALGKYNEAIECFDRAIKLSPSYTEALKNKYIALSNLREEKQYRCEQCGISFSSQSEVEQHNKQEQPIPTGISIGKGKYYCHHCGYKLPLGIERFCAQCGKNLAQQNNDESHVHISSATVKGNVLARGVSGEINIGRNVAVGDGTINVNEQRLTEIQNNEYAESLKQFSENINNQLKGLQVSEQLVRSINDTMNELAKEVKDVKLEKEEEIDHVKKIRVESKTASLMQKVSNVLPPAQANIVFTPLAPFSKIIKKGVSELLETVGKVEEEIIGKETIITRHSSHLTKTPEGVSNTEEDIKEKYPYAIFPEKISIGDIAPLKVIIKAVRPEPIKYTPIAQGIGVIKVDTSQGEKEVTVQVFVEQDNFEVVGGIYYKIMLVPVSNEDSKPAIFNLKAKKEGRQDITMQFFQQGTYIGELKVITNVLPKVPVYASMLQLQTQQQTVSEPISWDISRMPHRPDIMLYIYEKKRSPEYEYEIWLNSSEYDNYPIGSKVLTSEAAPRISAIFEDIENRNLPADIFDSKMKAKGRSLYKELFSDELKRFYWQNKDRIKSFQVITKDPWIPWELIRPYDADTSQEDPFLCECYAFSRWVAGKKTVIPNKQLEKVMVVVPSVTDLASAIEERDWIQQFGTSIGAEVNTNSKYRHVVSALEKGDFDILHFSTHGKYNKDHPLFSHIELENGLSLRPEDIGEMAVKFRQAKPIVILNTCQSGVQGFSLTEIKSWATQFLDAGASAFIGTLWRVSDKAAFKFTQELYKQLSAGIALGEAVQKARTSCKDPGDSSWLAYELYGQPNSPVKLGSRS